MKARKTTVGLTLELDVEVECSVSPGSRDYFDRGWGNWLPGDPPEVEVQRVLVNGVDVGEGALSKDDMERVVEAALEQAEEQATSDAADDGDRRYDAWRDEQMERGN